MEEGLQNILGTDRLPKTTGDALDVMGEEERSISKDPLVIVQK